MATQTSAVVSVSQLPCSIYFQSIHHRMHVQYLSRTKQADALLETTISITENQEMQLFIESIKYPVEIELPDVIDGAVIEPGTSEPIDIYTYESNQAFPWTPGYIIYSLKFEHTTYYGLIKIEPKNISDSEFAAMHQYLEDKLVGITKNFASDQRKLSDTFFTEEGRNSPLVDWFLSHYQTLFQTLKTIEKRAITHVKNTYVIEDVPKHVDQRSVRWQQSAKGISLSPAKYYNRKKVLTTNTAENRFVKSRTMEMLQTLKREQSKLVNERNQYPDMSWEDQLSDISKRFRKLHSIIHQLNMTLNNEFWRDVPGYPRLKTTPITSRNYGMFQQFWKRFQHQNKNDLKQDYILHPTSKLYEYYTFFKIIDALLQMNFTILHPDTKKQITAYADILPGAKVDVIKDNIKLSIVYDEELANNPNHAILQQTYFFSRSTKRRPDIRIDFYDCQTENCLYQSSVIFEIKYRPLDNFYSVSDYTPEMEQMDQYRQIKYYCPIREQYFSEIRNVFCIHPNMQEKQFLSTEVGTFLTLRPRYKEAFTNNLKQIFKHWLQI